MTARERYIETIRFGSPDRIPYRFGEPRPSTIAAWSYQGLGPDVDLHDVMGFDRWDTVDVDLLPLPRFDVVTLEEYDDKKIWIDELGATRIDHVNPATPGFVTRSWLDFPVKNRADYSEMKKRFDPRSPARFAADWNDYVAASRQRDHVLQLVAPGPFWRARDWVGFENLCLLCADDSRFVREMMDFAVDFLIETLRSRIDDLAIDILFVNEDMAYKTASMISPAMVRDLMVPAYTRLFDFARSAGVRSILIDCDGCIAQLLPIWIELGVDGTWPVEAAANNDPLEYRKTFGRTIALLGAIDKRELRFDFARVKREVMSKVPALLAQGGFIPGVDHGVPPDVPLRNFLYMAELIKALAEDRDPDNVDIDCYADVLGPVKEQWSMDLAQRLAMRDIS